MPDRDSSTGNIRIVLTIDDLKAQRQRTCDNDGSLPWLITFSDLMMILLVFSFAMYITHGAGPATGTIPRTQPRDSASLMTMAYATTGAPEVQSAIPLIVPERGQTPDTSHRSERIILREVIQYAHESISLNRYYRARLQDLTELHKHNPSSSIIVSVVRPRSESIAHQRIDTLIDHLVTACGVSREHIYIQHPAASVSNTHGATTLPEHAVDVRLSKPFWWF